MNTCQGEDYFTRFDCKDYLWQYYSAPSPQSFHLTCVHNFYATCNTKWDKRNARMLEFGGGPVIDSLISAAPYVREIVFSAYTENERKEVELWKDSANLHLGRRLTHFSS